ncbi:MAG: hypothetical protein KME25_26135 [Symplocastrum torsivum CPER-KK1]|uniref:Uncharacterized protein n=1 Tax=Symplocastrum torsivum CPER-KK1 TaxID=450513 RepID=A0A951PPY3_9CYAN|nr:hypothetical protein [Symplocastrum torsivum CPER-KK1]
MGLFNLQALFDKSDKAEPDLLEQYNPLVLLNSDRDFCLTHPDVLSGKHIRMQIAFALAPPDVCS